MVKRNYVGVSDPEREFRELRDAHTRLRRMQLVCTPFSADYGGPASGPGCPTGRRDPLHQGPIFLRRQAALGVVPSASELTNSPRPGARRLIPTPGFGDP